ncbi:hypothetical protein R3W88_025542 [Solanum pinnatisectum]|uniref:RNase H type-1 domain-containing protein n=1 Tax=Solanum pinnatisectum TaxID=50273 RepID=A0AAV9M5M3_9SOLN|nr:hypothetical protein R3W88_025542 [Solanum pinnatisectum]
MEAETVAILTTLRECSNRIMHNVIVETDSLSLKKIIQQSWRVPWEITEKVEEIREIMEKIRTKITHIFREGNNLTDSLANTVVESHAEHQYSCFQELPVKERRY